MLPYCLFGSINPRKLSLLFSAVSKLTLDLSSNDGSALEPGYHSIRSLSPRFCLGTPSRLPSTLQYLHYVLRVTPTPFGIPLGACTVSEKTNVMNPHDQAIGDEIRQAGPLPI